jgi:D-hexose-6-phosphate mutarotase
MPDTSELNARFALGEQLRFQPGPHGLPVAEIATPQATASVCLLGGHVLAFQPRPQRYPVLWLSDCSNYEVGKPIRGGIPVCWPWFGKHPTAADMPSHGFVRTRLWSVLKTQALPEGTVQIRLGLTATSETRALWPHEFDLQIVVTVGATLTAELVAWNLGHEDVFACTAALHTYLTVGDITRTTVHGLDGLTYIDTVADAWTRKQQTGPVTFAEEVDRIYLNTAADCLVEDPALGRRIRIAKSGSQTTVVWNPWIAKAKRMPDFGDDEYRQMVCVETTNAAEDRITLPPSGSHRLRTVISIE